MRMLERLVRLSGYDGRLAYHDPRWRRDRAPLLDHLGAVVDHREAFARGGAHDVSNFVTACNKCNARKNTAPIDAFTSRSPLGPVKGKYGEPTAWDGMSTVFVVLAKNNAADLSDREREWLSALEGDHEQVRALRRSIAIDGDTQPPVVSAARRAAIEMVRTMLPSPVRGETMLTGGEPGEVVVAVGDDAIEVMDFSVDWIDNHQPTVFGTLAGSFAIDAPAESIATAIMRSRARRMATFRWCPKCRSIQPPEWMMTDQCMSCFELAGGVF
jgi:hypothetical protein